MYIKNIIFKRKILEILVNVELCLKNTDYIYTTLYSNNQTIL